jgi:tellurite resistance protein TerC
MEPQRQDSTIPEPGGKPPSPLWRYARRIAVAVIGLSVLLFGVMLLVLPGPGLLVMFLGLSILALEFAWARRLVKKAREKTAELARRAGSKTPPTPS